MITLRSRTISIVLTFMMVFTTLFGNASFAMAATTETDADASTTVEQTVDSHDHDAATEEGGASDTDSQNATDSTADDADAATDPADDAQQTQDSTDQSTAADDQTVTDPAEDSTPAESAEPVTYNVDLAYTDAEDEDGNAILEAPANGDITFEYEDADGNTVEVTGEDLEAAANDDDIDDGMELTEGTEVTVTFTPDKGYETFYYMAYLAEDEDKEVKMTIDDEDDTDFTVERTATFEVGTDDIIVDILFQAVEADEDGSSNREEASTWAVPTNTSLVTSWSTTTGDDGYYYLDVLNGSVVNKDLYTLLTNKFTTPSSTTLGSFLGATIGGYKLDDGSLYVGSSTNTTVSLTHNKEYSVEYYKNYYRNAGTFVARVFYAPEVSVTAQSSSGESETPTDAMTGIIFNDNNGTGTYKVYYGDKVTIKVPVIEGYNAYINNSADKLSTTDSTGAYYVYELASMTSAQNFVINYKSTAAAPATVIWNIGENGTATIGGSQNTSYEPGTYSLIVTPATTTTTYSKYYVESIKVNTLEITNGTENFSDGVYKDETFVLESGKSYTINVVFAKREVSLISPLQIGINTYSTTTSYNSHIANIVPDNLVNYDSCVGVANDGSNRDLQSSDFVLKLSHRKSLIDSSSVYSTIDDIVSSGAWTWTFSMETRPLSAEWTGNDRYPTVIAYGNLSFVEARNAIEYVGTLPSDIPFNTVDEIEAAIVNAITYKYVDVNGTTQTGNKITADNVTVTLGEANGNSYEFTYSISIDGNENNLGGSTSGTGTAVAYVNAVDATTSGQGTVVLTDGADKETTLSATAQKVTPGNAWSFEITPDSSDDAKKYFVNSVTITETASGTTVTKTAGDEGYAVASDGTVTITGFAGTGATDVAETYSVAVDYGVKELTVTETSLGELAYNPVKALDTLENKIYTASGIVGTITGTTDNQITKWDDLTYVFNKGTDNEGSVIEDETNTVTLIWGTEYPVVSITVEFIPTDERTTAAVISSANKEIEITKDSTVDADYIVNEAYAGNVSKLYFKGSKEDAVPVNATLVDFDNFKLPKKQGEVVEVAVKVEYAETEEYKAISGEVTVKLVGAVEKTTVTVADADNGTVTVTNNSTKETISDDAIDGKTINTIDWNSAKLNIVATPKASEENKETGDIVGYYLDSLKVNGEEALNNTDNHTKLAFSYENYEIADGTGLALGENPGSYTITAVFKERTIELAEGDYELGYNFATKEYSKSDILKALGNENITVQYHDGSSWVAVDDNFGVDAEPDEKVKIRAYMKASGIYPEVAKVVYIKLVESRTKAVFTYDATPDEEGDEATVVGTYDVPYDKNITISFDTAADIETELAKLITTDKGTLVISTESSIDTGIDGIPQDGKIYKLYVAEGNNVLETTQYVVVSVVGIVHNATVVVDETNAGYGAGVTMTQTVDEEEVSIKSGDECAAGTVNFVVTPKAVEDGKGYYVKNVTVTDNNGNEADDLAWDWSNTKVVGSFTAENGDYEAAKVYTVKVEYGVRELKLKSPMVAIPYQTFIGNRAKIAYTYLIDTDALPYDTYKDEIAITIEGIGALDKFTENDVDKDGSTTIFNLVWTPSGNDQEIYPVISTSAVSSITVDQTDLNLEETATVKLELGETYTVEELQQKVLDKAAAVINAKLDGTGVTLNPHDLSAVSGLDKVLMQGEEGVATVEFTTDETLYYTASKQTVKVTVTADKALATVTVETTGEGTVTLPKADADGKYNANKDFEFTVEPEITKDDEGNIVSYYIDSVTVKGTDIDETYEVKDATLTGNFEVKDGAGLELTEDAPAYTITAVFKERTIELAEGPYEANYNFRTGQYSKEEIINLLGNDQVTVQYYNGTDWVELDDNFGTGETVKIRAYLAAGGIYSEAAKVVELKLVESRTKAVFTYDATPDEEGDEATVEGTAKEPYADIKTISFDTVDDIKTELAKLITTDKGELVISTEADIDTDIDGILQEGKIYKLYVAEGDDVLETTQYVKVTVEGIVHNATVVVDETNPEYGAGVTMTQIIDNEEVSINNGDECTAGTVDFVVTPKAVEEGKGYYVKNVTVTDNNDNEADDLDWDWSNTKVIGSFTAKNGDYEAPKVYTISVVYGICEMDVENADLDESYNPYVADVSAFEADLFNDAGVTISRDGDAITPVVIDNFGFTYSPGKDEPVINATGETNTITITWIGSKVYPDVSKDIKVFVTDPRNDSTVQDNNASITIDKDTVGNVTAQIEEAVRNGGASLIVGGKEVADATFESIEVGDYEIPKQGVTIQVEVDVTYEGTSTYKEATGTVVVNVTGKTEQAAVTVTQTGKGTVTLSHENGSALETNESSATANANWNKGVATLKVTPYSYTDSNGNTTAYYIDYIKINGVEVTDITSVNYGEDGSKTITIKDGSNATTGALEIGATPGSYTVEVAFTERKIELDQTKLVNGRIPVPVNGYNLTETIMPDYVKNVSNTYLFNYLKLTGGTAVASDLTVLMDTAIGAKSLSELSSGWYAATWYSFFDAPEANKTVDITWAANGKYPAVTLNNVPLQITESRKTPELVNVPERVEFDASAEEVLEKVTAAVSATADGKTLSGLTIAWADENRPVTNKDGEEQTATFTAKIDASADSLALDTTFTVKAVGAVHPATIDINAGGNGTVTLTDSEGNDVADGSTHAKDTLTLVATPNEGYHVESVQVIETATATDGSTVVTTNEMDEANEGKYISNYAYKDTFAITNGDYNQPKSYEVIVTFAKREIATKEPGETGYQVNYNIAKADREGYKDSILSDVYIEVVAEGSTPNGPTSVVNNGEWALGTQSFTITWEKTARYPAVSVTKDVTLTEDRQPAGIAGAPTPITTDTTVTVDDIIAAANVTTNAESDDVVITVLDKDNNAVTDTIVPVQGETQTYTVSVVVEADELDDYLDNSATYTVTVTGIIKNPIVTYEVINAAGGATTISHNVAGEVTSGETYVPGTLTITAVPTGNYYVDTVTVNGTAINTNQGTLNYEGTYEIADGTSSAVTADAPVYNVVVTYTAKVLGQKSSPYEVGYNPAKSTSAQLDTLKQNIFEAVVSSGEAGTSVPSNVKWSDLTYEYYHWIGSKASAYYKYHDETTVLGQSTPNAYGYDDYAFATSWISGTDFVTRNDNPSDANVEKIKLSWPASGKYPDANTLDGVYITLVDSRDLCGLTDGDLYIGEYDNADTLKAAILEALGNNSDINTESLSGLDVSFDANQLPTVAGDEATIECTVTYAGSEEYQPGSCKVQVTVVAKASKCYVYLDSTSETSGTVTVEGTTITTAVSAPVDGGNYEVKAQITPNSGKAVKSASVKAIYADKSEGTIESKLTYEGGVGYVTFNTTETSEAVSYYISVQYETASLVLKESSIDYCYDNKTDGAGNKVDSDELHEMVFNAVFNADSSNPVIDYETAMNNGNLKVEYIYMDVNILRTALKDVVSESILNKVISVAESLNLESWAEVGTAGNIPSALEFIVSSFSHEFGQYGEETIRVTYTDSKYGTIGPVEVKLVVNDACYNNSIEIVEVNDDPAINGTVKVTSASKIPTKEFGDGVEKYKADTEHTITVKPGNSVLDAYPESAQHIESIVVTYKAESGVVIKDANGNDITVAADENGNIIDVAGEITYVEAGEILGINYNEPTGQNTFTTGNNKEYVVIVTYGKTAFDVVDETVVLDKYEGYGEEGDAVYYPSVCPNAEDLFNAIVIEENSYPEELQTYSENMIVEYTTDTVTGGLNVGTFETDLSKLQELEDGTTIGVRISYDADGEKGYKYHTVAAYQKVTLLDQRAETTIVAVTPTEPVQYLEEELLLENLRAAMTPAVKAGTEVLDDAYIKITYGAFYTDEDGQVYTDVTFEYAGDNAYKPSSNTIKKVPVTDIPADTGITIESENGASTLYYSNGDIAFDAVNDVVTDALPGNRSFDMTIVPDEYYDVQSVTITKTPRESENADQPETVAEEDEESDSQNIVTVELDADPITIPEEMSEELTNVKVIFADQNVKITGLKLLEKYNYVITVNYVKPAWDLKTVADGEDNFLFDYRVGYDSISELDKIEILNAVVDGSGAKDGVGTIPALYLDEDVDDEDAYKIREKFAEDPDRLHMKYLAAGDRPITITVDLIQILEETLNIQMGTLMESLLEKIGLTEDTTTIEIEMTVEEAWMEVGAPIEQADTSPQAIMQYLMDDIAAGELTFSWNELSSLTDTEYIKTKIAAALQDELAGNGAHAFGDYGHASTETIKFYYEDDQYLIPTVTTTVEINDPRTETQLNINDSVTVQYGLFDEASVLELLATAEGASLVQTVTGDVVADLEGGAISIPSFPSDVKTLDVGSHTFEVKYAGDEFNRPSTAKFTLVIEKAPVEVNVASGIYRYGTELDQLITTDPEGAKKVDIAIGLDISEVVDGQPTIVAKVNIKDLIDISDSISSLESILSGLGINLDLSALKGENVEMTLSELYELLDTLVEYGGYLGIDTATVESIKTILDTINPESLGVDVKIVLNPDNMIADDENIGVYLLGAVTTDSNYETAYNVGYAVIYPDGHKAELEWNINDDNFIVTLPYVQNGEYDLNASVTKDKVYEGNIEDAQEAVSYLTLGYDINGEVVTNVTKNANEGVGTYGAYTQIAFMQNFGNEMYYCMPIIRAMVVVPDTVKMEIPDSGAEFIYDGQPHGLDESLVECYDKNGNRREDWEANTEFIEYTYLGYDGNDIAIYNSTEPPTNVGVYTVIATYIEHDNPDDPDSGRYGMGIGYMTIKPAEVTLDVEDRIMTLNDYNALADAEKDGVTVEPEDCKYISMIAGVGTDGNILTEGLDSVSGAVNIDFPNRIDKVLKQILPEAYEDGMSIDKVIEQLDSINASLVELGLSQDVADIITDFLGQVPTGNFISGTKVTFHEQEDLDLGMGVYVVGAVTCDPNYTADSDFGYLILSPETTEVELAWNINDNNMIITNTLIKQGVYDMGSKVLQGELTDEQWAAATEKMADLIIGVDIDGNMVMTNSAEFKDTVKIGAYTQVAYILDDGTEIYYATPIARAFVVVAELAEVKFENDEPTRTFTYTGEPQGMKAEVFTIENDRAEAEQVTDEAKLAECLTLRYIGYDAKGIEIYNSTTPPTNMGAYTVIATYADKTNDIYGVAMGAMVIEPATSSITIENYSGTAEGFSFDQMITTEPGPTVVIDEEPEYISVIAGVKGEGSLMIDGVNYVDGVINIDLPDWLEPHIEEYMPEGWETGITMPELEEFFNYLEKNVLPELVGGYLEEYGLGTEILSVVMDMVEEMAQGQVDIKITFAEEEDLVPTIGAYLVGGVVFDANYWYSVDTGTAIITPEVTNAVIAYTDPFTRIKLDEVEKLVEAGTWKDKLSAKAYEQTEEAAELPSEWIIYLYYGTTLDGETYVSEEPPTEVGIYTEVAILIQMDETKAYYADPLARVFEIERLSPELDMVATDKVYDGEPVDYKIMVDDGEDLTDEEKALADVIITHLDTDEINGKYSELFTVSYEQLTEDGSSVTLKEAPVNVGQYFAVVSFAGTDRYAPVEYLKVRFDITKKPIEATILEGVDTDLTCADDEIELTYEWTDGEPVEEGEVVINLDNGGYEAGKVGEYTITGTPADDYANYEITIVDGKITVSHTWATDEETGDLLWKTPKGEEPTCTETGYRYHYCKDCGTLDEESQDIVPANGHTEVIDAAEIVTCTTPGKTMGKHCSVCNEILEAQEVVPALGHDEVKHDGQDPTCEGIGWDDYYTCRRCDYTTYEPIPALGHTEVEIPAVDPTCTETGLTDGVKCSVCNKVLEAQEEVKALGHAYQSVVTAPTCTEEGYTTHTCTRCDHTYTDATVTKLGHNLVDDAAVEPTCTTEGKDAGQHCNREGCGYVADPQIKIDALGHHYVLDKGYAATCTEPGLTDGYHCDRCGAIELREYDNGERELMAQKVIAATGHTEVDDAAVPATCTSTGLTAGKHCSVCDAVTVPQQTVAKLAHTPVTDAAVAATCTKDGLTEGSHCSVCNTVIVAQEVIKAAGHKPEFKDDVPPTCTNTGLIHSVKCTVCNEQLSAEEIIPALNHNMVKDPAVAATCTTTGLTEGAHCTECDYVIEQTETPVIAHTYGEWEVVKAATCTEKGVEKQSCTVCGDTVERAIDLAEHNYKEVVVEPTCTESGESYKACEDCGVIIDMVKVRPTGHKFENYKSDGNATCTTDGTKTAVCENGCNTTDTVVIEGSAGHSYAKEFTVDTEATCTTDGSKSRHCAECDAVTDVTVIKATGHTPVIDEAVKATCTTAGKTEGAHCGVCGETIVAQETVEANGHSYGDWTTVKAATCTITGLEKQTCADCGHAVYRAVAAAGHTYEWQFIDGDCTTGGTKFEVCTECDEVRNITVVPAAGHSFGEYVSDGNATCTEDGTKTRTCPCGATETVTDKGSATGHAFTKYVDNGDATCMKAGTATAVCDNKCGATDTKSTAKADHDFVTIKAANATCTEDGHTAGVYCSECGTVVLESTVIQATGHTVVTDPETAATCERAGWTEGSHCAVCDETLVKQERIPATGHEFTNYISNDDATCTKDGTKTAECNNCDATDTAADKGSAKGHSYLKDAEGKIIYTEVKAPTCTEEGLMTAKCAVCGGAEIEKSIAPLGHNVVTDKGYDATCEKAGLTDGTHCDACNTILTVQKEIPATGHSFTDYVSNGDATCTEDGTKTATCDNCDKTDTVADNGSAAGHEYLTDKDGQLIFTVVKEPTCTETGLTEVRCTVCDELKFTMTTAAKGHDIVIDKPVAATCTEDGLTTGIHCGTCGEVIKAQETVAAKGHTVVIDPAIAPTETQTGLTEGSHCGTCGEVLKAQEVVPALGKDEEHKHTVVTDPAVAPTCTETGLTEGSHCSECGEVIKAQEVVPALGHSYGEEQYQKPTADADGGWYRECANCGDRQWTKVQTWAQYIKAGVNATTIKATATASLKTETITVNWTKSGNFAVTYYNVYRSKTGKDGSFAKIGTSTTKTYTDKTAKPGTKYYYRVRGVRTLDGVNYLTQLSNKPYAKIKKVTAAYVKETKMVIRSYYAGKAIKVTWTSPRIKVDGFEIWRSKSLNGKYTKIKTTKTDARQWTNTGLKLQDRWYYKVRGYKIINGKKVYTQWSKKGYRYVLNAKNAKLANAIEDANVITAKKATKVSGGIKVTWTKDKAIKCNKYEIWRSTSKNGKYTKIATTKNMNYTDKSSSLKKGKRYYYKIVGYRFFGKACPKTKDSNVVSAVK